MGLRKDEVHTFFQSSALWSDVILLPFGITARISLLLLCSNIIIKSFFMEKPPKNKNLNHPNLAFPYQYFYNLKL